MKHRILYFSDCVVYGGSERNIINLMNYVADHSDIEVFFAYRYFKSYQQGVERDLSKKVHPIPLRLFATSTLFNRINSTIRNPYVKVAIKLPFWIMQKVGVLALFDFSVLYKTFKKIGPDLLHVNNGGYPASFVCQTAIFAAHCDKITKIIYHINNPAAEQSNFLDRWIDSYINKYTTYFITASQQANQSLQKNRFFDQHKLLQIYNTIEPPYITKTRDEILKEHNVDIKKFILCEVAFLSKRKGQFYLLKALNHIKSYYPDIFAQLVLFLVGDGEDDYDLKCYCQQNKLNNVIFTGYLPNHYDFINASDIFLLPSTDGEDMPLVILEAMSLQKPIVSTQIAGIIEEIENNKSGLLLKVNDLDNLYLAIVELFNNKKLRDEFALNAKKRFEKHFTRQHVYKAFLSVYEKLL